MALYRTKNDQDVSFYKNEQHKHQFGNDSEWEDEQSNLNIKEECRIDIDSWQYRYNFESELLSDIITTNNIKKIIELGSGPGELGQKILNKKPDLDYTFIDQVGAEKIFKKRKFLGKFIVKDLMNSFNTSDLEPPYDFLITNDFLEHIYNPSVVMQESYKIIKNDGFLFVSVPNWRMGHTFIYRGLFDFDNFIYFSETHGFKVLNIFRSPLVCMNTPKLDTETLMDDSLITSWNWYFLFKKII